MSLSPCLRAFIQSNSALSSPGCRVNYEGNFGLNEAENVDIAGATSRLSNEVQAEISPKVADKPGLTEH